MSRLRTEPRPEGAVLSIDPNLPVEDLVKSTAPFGRGSDAFLCVSEARPNGAATGGSGREAALLFARQQILVQRKHPVEIER
jgi:hypothetical protein